MYVCGHSRPTEFSFRAYTGTYIHMYYVHMPMYVCMPSFVHLLCIHTYIYIRTYMDMYMGWVLNGYVCMQRCLTSIPYLQIHTYLYTQLYAKIPNDFRLPRAGPSLVGTGSSYRYLHIYLLMSNVPSYPGAVSYTLVTGFVYARPGHVGHLYKRKMTYTFLSPRRSLSH